MKFLKLACLSLLLASQGYALEASASMGNIRKSPATETKVAALTAIVESLGTTVLSMQTSLTTVETELAEFKKCADQGMIYDSVKGCTQAIPEMEMTTVSAGLVRGYADRMTATASCPADYERAGCTGGATRMRKNDKQGGTMVQMSVFYPAVPSGSKACTVSISPHDMSYAQHISGSVQAVCVGYKK